MKHKTVQRCFAYSRVGHWTKLTWPWPRTMDHSILQWHVLPSGLQDLYCSSITTPYTPEHFARTTWPKKTKKCWLQWTFLHSDLSSTLNPNITWRLRKSECMLLNTKIFIYTFQKFTLYSNCEIRKVWIKSHAHGLSCMLLHCKCPMRKREIV